MGYAAFNEYFRDDGDRMNIVGMTNRLLTQKGATPYGHMEYPVKNFLEAKPDVIIMASMRYKSFLRELYEMVPDGKSYRRVERYNVPVAFVYR